MLLCCQVIADFSRLLCCSPSVTISSHPSTSEIPSRRAAGLIARRNPSHAGITLNESCFSGSRFRKSLVGLPHENHSATPLHLQFHRNTVCGVDLTADFACETTRLFHAHQNTSCGFPRRRGVQDPFSLQKTRWRMSTVPPFFLFLGIATTKE